MTTIIDGFTTLKQFLLPGVSNLSNDDLLYALSLVKSLINAALLVDLPYELDIDRRDFVNQLKIIQRELQDVASPEDPRIVLAIKGQNLYKIALDQLGDCLRWQEILDLNNLSDPFLCVTQELKLPE